jgi:hypothetical protein
MLIMTHSGYGLNPVYTIGGANANTGIYAILNKGIVQYGVLALGAYLIYTKFMKKKVYVAK